MVLRAPSPFRLRKDSLAQRASAATRLRANVDTRFRGAHVGAFAEA